MSEDLVRYAQLSSDKLATQFETSLTAGLSKEETAKKRKQYGLNEIAPSYAYPFYLFLKEFFSPFVIIFILVGSLSLVMKEYINGIIVLCCVFFNILITRYQEHKSENYIESLKKYLLSSVTVVRNNASVSVSSRELVPGDIILLKQGDIIPADVRFIEVHEITLDQSTLTGESTPIAKTAEPADIHSIFDAANIGFSGSSVLTGQAKALVLSIGKGTYFTQSVNILASIKESDFHKKINHFSYLMTIIILISVLFLFILTLIFKSHIGLFNIFMFSSALALSITPEALPAIVTFALSRAVNILAQSSVIIKRFSALQDMGSMDILCVDKTGTLTENKLTVSQVIPYQQEDPLFYAALLNSTPPEKGFDEALVQALSQEDLDRLLTYDIVFTQTFDPIKRSNVAVLRNKKTNECIYIMRGAFEHIVPTCNLSQEDFNVFHQRILQESTEGKRSLAVGYKLLPEGDYTHHDWAKEDTNLSFAGCISFYDPIKKTAAATIETAQRIGVQLRILSGDMKEVCALVAQKLKLINDPKEVLSGEEYMNKSPEEKDAAVEQTIVFARMLPEQKLDVLKRLQNKKYIVGFLGDGMNDMAALSVADIAITVENALDMVRDTADIILLRKSLRAIINGIKESRIVFSNINKYIYSTIAGNFGNFFALAASVFIVPYLVLLPIQVIINNFLTDLPSMALAADQVDISELHKPKKFDLKFTLWITLLFGIISMIVDLAYIFFFKNDPESVMQTGFFVLSTLTGVALILSLRCQYSVFYCAPPSKVLLLTSLGAVLFSILVPFTAFGTHFIHLAPISFARLNSIIFLTIIYFIVNEITKKIVRSLHLFW